MTKKTFKLVCTENDEGMIEMRMQNDGFNGMEIIAILETKKADLIEQTTHPEKFRHEREYKDTDGSTVKKIKEGEETSEESGVVKNEENCIRCVYNGYSGSKCKGKPCFNCDNKNTKDEGCLCCTVDDGQVCPYFEEDK